MIRKAVIASIVVLFAATIESADKSAAQLSPLTAFYTAPVVSMAPMEIGAQLT